MKLNRILLFLSLIFTNSYVVAGMREKKFAQGNKVLYSTKNHPKAKGVNLNIFYPSDWTALEGDRPNIVQKFKDNSQNGVYALIIIKELPIVLTRAEELEFFKNENLKDYFPLGAKVISTEKTQLDGYDAGKVNFIESRSSAGKNLKLNVLTYMVLVERKILATLYFGTSSDDDKEAAAKMEKTKELFFLMANSVVFPDKWK